jgi:hypothetical protein
MTDHPYLGVGCHMPCRAILDHTLHHDGAPVTAIARMVRHRRQRWAATRGEGPPSPRSPPSAPPVDMASLDRPRYGTKCRQIEDSGNVNFLKNRGKLRTREWVFGGANKHLFWFFHCIYRRPGRSGRRAQHARDPSMPRRGTTLSMDVHNPHATRMTHTH